jgi:DNA end-binding protein Ku
MARAVWSGAMTFGLVSVPVQVYSATEAHEPEFHQFEKGTADRIRYQRVNERTGAEVEYSDVVKGASIGGKYVMLDADELEAVAPGRSRSLEIQTFVDLEEIDPIYFSKTYFLGPRGDETKKTYALLRDAMANSNKAAIASFVMRSKEYLAAIRADGDLLVLETLFFADEIRDPHHQIGNLPGRVKVSPKELRMARQLIDAMSEPWKPSDYRDTYTDRVNELIDAKKHDKQFEPAAEAPAATSGGELADVLRASLDTAKRGRSQARRKQAAARKSPAKKTAAKKTRKRAA